MQLNIEIPDTTDEQVAELRSQIESIQERIDSIQRLRMLKCLHCSQPSMISTLTYIQTYWYEEPHGCSGGACWRYGDGAYRCPHCERINKIMDSDKAKRLSYDSHECHVGLDDLKRYFAEAVESYE